MANGYIWRPDGEKPTLHRLSPGKGRAVLLSDAGIVQTAKRIVRADQANMVLEALAEQARSHIGKLVLDGCGAILSGETEALFAIERHMRPKNPMVRPEVDIDGSMVLSFLGRSIDPSNFAGLKSRATETQVVARMPVDRYVFPEKVTAELLGEANDASRQILIKGNILPEDWAGGSLPYACLTADVPDASDPTGSLRLHRVSISGSGERAVSSRDSRLVATYLASASRS